MLTKESLYSYLTSWTDVGDLEIVEEGQAYTCTFRVPGKEFVLTTPYEVGEFFIGFFGDDTQGYEDWYEIMDDEPEEFMEFTHNLIRRYLYNETRTRKEGIIFRRDVLEFKSPTGWKNIYEAET